MTAAASSQLLALVWLLGLVWLLASLLGQNNKDQPSSQLAMEWSAPQYYRVHYINTSPLMPFVERSVVHFDDLLIEFHKCLNIGSILWGGSFSIFCHWAVIKLPAAPSWQKRTEPSTEMTLDSGLTGLEASPTSRSLLCAQSKVKSNVTSTSLPR